MRTRHPRARNLSFLDPSFAIQRDLSITWPKWILDRTIELGPRRIRRGDPGPDEDGFACTIKAPRDGSPLSRARALSLSVREISTGKLVPRTNVPLRPRRHREKSSARGLAEFSAKSRLMTRRSNERSIGRSIEVTLGIGRLRVNYDTLHGKKGWIDN